MSQISDRIATLKSELTAAVSRVADDVAALKAKVEAGAVTAEDFANLDEAIGTLKALDPDPDNPPPG